MQDDFFTAAQENTGSPERPRPPPTDHRKNLVQLIETLAHRHSTWRVFSDFVEMAAISLSNAVDLSQREKREAQYLEIVKRYTAEEVQQFPKMLAELTLALEEGPDDVLGRVFHDLELHQKYAGQFFTPYDVCRMMAKMTIDDAADLEERIANRGFVTVQEPACGGGAMLIALAEELKDAGVNYQQALHATAVDVDAKCVHMTYVQLSLLHIPAIVIHGNSLSLEQYSVWHTPAHVFGGWNWKLRKQPDEPEPAIEVPRQSERPSQDEDPSQGNQLTLF